MRYEIFRAGTRTDNSGRTITITPEQVAAIASHYSPSKHEAPIVVGHPSLNAPAYGWVGSLKAENGTLYANFAQVDDDFAELVRKGRYKKVSASFYPPNHPSNPQPENWYLRHVGFLGAHPPAVKGLAAIDFADDEDGVVSFGESDWLLSRMLRNLREWLIGKDGLETADRVLPDWQIEAVAPPPAPEPEAMPNNFSEPRDKDDTMTPEQQLEAERKAREQAEAEAKQAREELAKLQAEQEKSLRDAAHQQNADFAEGLIKAGSLKPADKELIVAVLDFTDYPEAAPADFGEGKKLSDALKDFLRGGVPIVAAGEIATAERAGSLKTIGSSDFGEYANPDAQSHHQRALALAKQENIPYEEAARRTINA